MANVTDAPGAQLDHEGMDRGVGFLGLLWSSEGSIIGSGWLFGALTAASIAGPSAILAWIIASFIIILLALVHAELGGLFPVTGGTSRFPHYAFGSLAGATFGWFAYLQAASVAPIEVLAAIQYGSSYSFAHSWYNASGNTLHGFGYVVAIILMFLFTFFNVIGIRWLARINTALTSWKVLIPILAIVVLLITHFHSGNFSHGGGFFVKGAAIKSILIAIPGGGIVFSLLGFEQAVQLGGEARNPKDLPRAVIGSILLGSVVYILVQIAFIGALEPSLLAKAGTWTSIATPGHSAAVAALQAAPFYTVAKVAGIAWLAVILRVDAIISPGGTGLIYLTSASRIAFGLSRNGYIPQAFERNSARTKVPLLSIIISAVIGLLFLLPFPSWSKLVGVVTSASVLMYAGAPLAMGVMRLQKPDLPRPYRLPAAQILCPLAFVCATFVVYWAGWSTYTTLMVALLVGYALMMLSAALHLNPEQPKVDWGAAVWIFPYLIGMLVIAYFGTFGGGGIIGGVGVFKNVLDHGGNNDLGLWGGLAASAGWSLIIYFMAMRSRLSEPEIDHYVREVYPPPVTE
jgi:amino acid transporter